MPKRLILVAGNIGSGKTSLTERIGSRLGWKTAFESVADNPYLPDFYADMQRWSFHLQVFFLGHRAQQHLDLWNAPESAIIDRSIYEDAHIFARALNHLGNMSGLEFNAYRKVYEFVVKNLPVPSLLVYLRAPVPLLMERIRARARNMETSITPEYLSLLERFYDEWIAGFDLCPVLTLQTGDMDFVHQPQHMDLIIARLNEMLAGKEEIFFD